MVQRPMICRAMIVLNTPMIVEENPERSEVVSIIAENIVKSHRLDAMITAMTMKAAQVVRTISVRTPNKVVDIRKREGVTIVGRGMTRRPVIRKMTGEKRSDATRIERRRNIRKRRENEMLTRRRTTMALRRLESMAF